MDARTILDNVREVSARFAAERGERQQRQGLVAADFAQLREAGFPLIGVPVDHGGIWESVRQSTVGIVETALEAARPQVARRRDALRAYERVEWTRAEQEGWLIQQAYEGMLRAVEEDRDGRRHVIQGKTAIAELAEAATGRICRVLGGGTFSRSSPFGYWYEDVRALGFLRPPWGLAYDQLYAWSLAGLA